nr:heme ABC transporter ATP-binding protein [Phytoactinopolyspora halophila]
MSVGLRRGTGLPEPVDVGDVIAAIRDAEVSLGGARVLQRVSLEIRAGEVLALVGPNGAGKSTLLSVLTADVMAGAGDVELYGRPVASWSPVAAAMRRAVLLQQVTVSFPFTVAEVVAMGRAPWTNTARERDDGEAIAEAMRLADVERFATRRFHTLSGGERARTALARVLAQRTQLILLDEPTAALDVRHQELVLGLARERAAAGDAVVLVLHDLNSAAGFADRVAVLSGGRLVADGPPSSVFTADLLSDVYQHGIEVLTHPRTATPIVLPVRV